MYIVAVKMAKPLDMWLTNQRLNIVSIYALIKNLIPTLPFK